jgi:hypothetical protein
MYCLCTQQLFIEWKIPSINLVLPTHSTGKKIQTLVKIHEGANRDLNCSRSSSGGQRQEQQLRLDCQQQNHEHVTKSSSAVALTAIPAPQRTSPACHGRTPPPASLPVQQGFYLWPWMGVMEMGCGRGLSDGNGERGGPDRTAVANHATPATLPKG